MSDSTRPGPDFTAAQAGQPAPAAAPQGAPSAPAPAKKKSPVVPIVAGVAALALIGGGVAYATGMFGGGGAQPSSVVPAEALVYASLDLNPTAAQKANAAQFLSKFPAAKDKKLTDQNEVRKAAWEALFKDDETYGAANFDTDVKPWLGDRLAAASFKGGSADESLSAHVFAATDKAKGKESLNKVVAEHGDACEIAGDFVVCAKKDELAKVMTTDPSKSLDAKKEFKDDLAGVSGDAVALAWGDLAGIAEAAKASGTSSSPTADQMYDNLKGRFAAKARFDGGNALEVAGQVKGSANTATPKAGTQIDKVSADAIAAVSVNGLDESIKAAWPQISKSIDSSSIEQVEQAFDLKLPDDLGKALGGHTTIAFMGLGSGTGLASLPKVALVTDGDKAVVDKVLSQAMGLIEASQEGDALVVSTRGTDAAGTIKGGLAETAAFKAAVPKAGESNAVAYVDVAKVLALPNVTKDLSEEQKKNAEVLQAIGGSGVQKGADGTFTYRMTTKS